MKNAQENTSIRQGPLQLRTVFEEIVGSVVDGVAGVWHVRADKPGPAVGITILTHGNEPSGLAAYHHFRHVYQLECNLQRGDVYFVLNNSEAGRRYFEAAASSDENAKERTRFVDVNMNRLPDDPFSDNNDQRYEVQRAREVCKEAVVTLLADLKPSEVPSSLQ